MAFKLGVIVNQNATITCFLATGSKDYYRKILKMCVKKMQYFKKGQVCRYIAEEKLRDLYLLVYMAFHLTVHPQNYPI